MTPRKPNHSLTALSLLAALALVAAPELASADPGGDKKTHSAPAKKVEKAKKAPPKETPRKVKHYDFEGDDIRGDGILPSGDNIFVPRPMKHGSLIRLRASFLPEIVRAAAEVR